MVFFQNGEQLHLEVEAKRKLESGPTTAIFFVLILLLSTWYGKYEERLKLGFDCKQRKEGGLGEVISSTSNQVWRK